MREKAIHRVGKIILTHIYILNIKKLLKVNKVITENLIKMGMILE